MPAGSVREAVDLLPSRRSRRRVAVASAAGTVPVDVSADAFTDVVTALLDDCLTGGRDAVRAEVSDHGTHVELVVSDKGPRRSSPDLVHAGTVPSHLAQALTTAEFFGGRLMIVDAPTHRHRLLVPSPTP